MSAYTDYTPTADIAAGDTIITVEDYGPGKVYVWEREVIAVAGGKLVVPHDSFSPRKPRTVTLTRSSKYLAGGVIRHAG